MTVFLSNAAEADIEEIGDWIAQDAPLAAVKYVSGLRAACSDLGRMPRAFVLLPHRPESGIRRRVYRSHLIFYCVSDKVDVLRVLHGARDYDAILFPEPRSGSE